MTIGILRETGSENRVAILPGEVALLKKMNLRVLVEPHAGDKAYASDAEYEKAAAEITARQRLIKESDILVSVNLPIQEQPDVFKPGQLLCSLVSQAEHNLWIEDVRERGLTLLALNLVPRITRAQTMDVLSSMATISGYKAVLDAAFLLPRFFPMFMSASGTTKPAKVLILGAGVAGLQALATARKLGAVVEVFDVRSAVKEEVKSLGGRFVEVEGSKEDILAGGYAVEQTEEFREKQKKLIQQHSIASNVIICTAQIPGKKAPVLVTSDTVRSMKPGSVIIDIAASTGGNCELTVNGEIISINMVTIVGRTDYPSLMSADSSRMFGNNLTGLLKLIIDKEGQLILNLNDEIIRETMIVHNYEYVNKNMKQLLNSK
ncbi:MAG TPA: Re/Si-specific NAD(P)(+) transhydrogenase subunit alpha [Bacteroidales bacterium]|nr:Re/Si-specific NAD(P)(+) transhydrogenase subunit alpha [Bacteroidales bacterium]